MKIVFSKEEIIAILNDTASAYLNDVIDSNRRMEITPLATYDIPSSIELEEVEIKEEEQDTLAVFVKMAEMAEKEGEKEEPFPTFADHVMQQQRDDEEEERRQEQQEEKDHYADSTDRAEGGE